VFVDPRLDDELWTPWEEVYGHPLNEAERLGMMTDLSGFFGLLASWQRAANEEVDNQEVQIHGQQKKDCDESDAA
jgi:hypothetical protein